jgi:hypothetical protein
MFIIKKNGGKILLIFSIIKYGIRMDEVKYWQNDGKDRMDGRINKLYKKKKNFHLS